MPPADLSTDAGGELFVEEHFAMVPEWILDSALSDCSVRLYAVLLRYGQSSGARMPSRSTLAARLRKKSTDTVDRAMRELVNAGAVQVQARYSGRERLTNLYRVRVGRPNGPGVTPVQPGHAPEPLKPTAEGSRKNAATRIYAAGRSSSSRGSRKNAARVAADLRPNPKFFTQSNNPPPPSSTTIGPEIGAQCEITDWDAFVEQCISHRRRAGLSVDRWAGPCLEAALQLAVRARRWPSDRASQALLEVAADPESRSPMRVAEAGPWWDSSPDSDRFDPAKVTEAELALAEADGLRVSVQAQARADLKRESLPVTRASVALRAYELLLSSVRASEGKA